MECATSWTTGTFRVRPSRSRGLMVGKPTPDSTEVARCCPMDDAGQQLRAAAGPTIFLNQDTIRKTLLDNEAARFYHFIKGVNGEGQETWRRFALKIFGAFSGWRHHSGGRVMNFKIPLVRRRVRYRIRITAQRHCTTTFPPPEVKTFLLKLYAPKTLLALTNRSDKQAFLTSPGRRRHPDFVMTGPPE